MHTTDTRNNCLCAYMGGPDYIRENYYSHLDDKEFKGIGPSHMHFNSSWDWAIPCWKKIRFEMTPTMIIHAISCIDDAAIEPLFELMSNVAIDWCKKNGIDIEN
jgi:hypothetical protein